MMKRGLVCDLVVAMAMVVATSMGCSSDGGGGDLAKTYPVTGTVTYNGRPVVGASVVFVPTAKTGEAAVAVTDASGKYALKSSGAREGAVPGSYGVKISKAESQDEAASAGDSGGDSGSASSGDDLVDDYGANYNPDAEEDEAAPKSMNFLPAKYGSPSTSGLSATVSNDTSKNVFDFTLKD